MIKMIDPNRLRGLPFPPEVIQTCLSAAQAVRDKAYAPYSNYTVGSCVYAQDTINGHWAYFSGCNVENASYGMTICAERVAIFNAVSFGHRNIGMLAIATPKRAGMSCGGCRQVEYEFNPNMYIISIGERGDIKHFMLNDALPNAFGPHNLK